MDLQAFQVSSGKRNADKIYRKQINPAGTKFSKIPIFNTAI